LFVSFSCYALAGPGYYERYFELFDLRVEQGFLYVNVGQKTWNGGGVPIQIPIFTIAIVSFLLLF